MGVKKSIQGSGNIILNIIRAMNITSLTAVVVASAIMLVRTFVVSKFFFFDAVSHIITASLSMFLIITELPIMTCYVARNWPLLSPSSGFVTLGVLMVFTGTSILGNLNKEATSEQSLGLSFWQIVIASGILTLILGVINIIANYIFRRTAVGITARMIRTHGATAAQKAADALPRTVSPPFNFIHHSNANADSASTTTAFPGPIPASSTHEIPPSHYPFRALRQSFGLARSTPSVARVGRAPSISSYYGSTIAAGGGGGRSHSPVSEMSSVGGTYLPPRSTYDISAPLGRDQEEQEESFARFKGTVDVRRPDSALHPAYMNRF